MHPRPGTRYLGPGMQLADWFAERSLRGMLTRMVGAWLFIGVPVVAARIWWSVTAAIVIFAIALAIYVVAAVGHMRRHRKTV